MKLTHLEKQDLLSSNVYSRVLEPIIHDTFEITEIYLQRPTSLSTMKMSVWFCQAHGIKDWDLLNAASLGDFKRQLIDKGYRSRSLEILREFNEEWSKKTEGAKK